MILALGVCIIPVSAVYADASASSFDDTYVLNDLKDSVINGKPFYSKDYPQNDGGQPRLLELAEWSFSTKFEYMHDFGLYFYFYNPTAKQILQHQLNKIQIADSYDSEGNPSTYKKYNLTICSQSVDGLFYKFKITEPSEIYSRVVLTSERRYDVSGIEVFFEGAINATEFEIGGTWIYTGFAKGMATESSSESTLVSTSRKLQTVVLDDLKFTYFRTWKNLAGTLADQLTSVYFSVDRTLLADYDDLFSIQAECFKYLTSPVFCLYDKYILGVSSLLVDYSKLYSDLLKQRGADNNREGVSLGWDNNGSESYLSVYNAAPPSIGAELKVLAWLFQVTQKTDWSVNSERLLSYMKEYSSTFGKEINGKYSSSLFSDKYYSYLLDYKTVTNGYMPINISAGDSFTLTGSSRKATFWDLLTLGTTFDRSESEPMSPIVTVTYSDVVNLSDNELSETYLVAANDVSSFRESVKNADNNGRITYLFRFDTTDYVTYSVVYGNKNVVGYMAQETAYLDFDVISLGYRKNGVVTTIPVVNSPIDILPTVEPGQKITDILSNLKNGGLKLLPLIVGLLLVIAIVKLAFSLFKGGKKRRR